MFQLDASAGATAGVAEMLLQSHSHVCPIHVLPALPPRWTDGEVSGLRARGGLRVNVRWAAGRLAQLSVAFTTAPTAATFPVTLCCAASLCGEDEAALSARAGAPLSKVPAPHIGHGAFLWRWRVELGGESGWSLSL